MSAERVGGVLPGEAARQNTSTPWQSLTGYERHAACLVAARHNDVDALNALVSELTPLVWYVARGQGLDRADTEDVVQSVWLTLLHNLHSVTEPRALTNWLIVTTRREASKVRGSTDRVDPLPDNTLEFLTSAEGLPEEESLRNDRDRQLWRAFCQLSQREQDLLRLTVLSGRAEYDRVAKELGLARGSIGPLRGRAIARLRTMLVEEESITHEERLSDEATALTEHGSRQGSPAQQVTTSLRPHELLEERNAIDQIANKVDDELRTRFTKARNAFGQRHGVHVTDTAGATTFRILGPMEVRGTGGTTRIPPGRPQVILASLLMEANQIVTMDHLVNALWEGAPPSTARTQVQISVSRLRKSLTAAGADTQILSQPPGYLLPMNESQLDMHIFTGMLAEARALAKQGRPADTVALLRSAAALWRGPCLAGIPHRALRTRALRLDEDRLDAIETYMELEIGLGLHHQLVGELAQLVHEHPLRERLRGLLMRALYLAGRQAEALAVYMAGRDMLIDELGLELGDELRSLKNAILAGDTSLLRSTQQAPKIPEWQCDGADQQNRLFERPAPRAVPVRTAILAGSGGPVTAAPGCGGVPRSRG